MSTPLIVRETSPLASIQIAHSPRPIPKRDQIVTAQVQGYRVVVNKETFFPHETTSTLCVFFQVDSLLPSHDDEFKFLDSSRGRLVTTKKMFGTYSQGLCMPLSILTRYGIAPDQVQEGQDLTVQMKVSKYVSPEESGQYVVESKTAAPFPLKLVPKTDEPSLQSYQKFLTELKGRAITVTVKLDGSSMTVTDQGGLCGRNFQWLEKTPSNSAYFEVEERLQIRQKIAGSGLCVQGELVGPKIQKNKLGLDQVQWFVFNMFHTQDNRYLPFPEVMDWCKKWGFSHVPVLQDPQTSFDDLGRTAVEDWLQWAESVKYPNGQPAEGIVIKTADDRGPRLSFKVISRVYAADTQTK